MGWGEALRVFGHSEKNCRFMSVITLMAKSVNPCPDLMKSRPVARGAGIKKGELRSVHLFKLVAIINMKSRSEISQLQPARAGWCG